jgi:hypothetical protein
MTDLCLHRIGSRCSSKKFGQDFPSHHEIHNRSVLKHRSSGKHDGCHGNRKGLYGSYRFDGDNGEEG